MARAIPCQQLPNRHYSLICDLSLCNSFFQQLMSLPLVLEGRVARIGVICHLL